jgi:hypothetical protein
MASRGGPEVGLAGRRGPVGGPGMGTEWQLAAVHFEAFARRHLEGEAQAIIEGCHLEGRIMDCGAVRPEQIVVAVVA